MSKRIVLIGGGGHAKSVIASLRKNSEWSIDGIIDNKKYSGQEIEGIKYIGTDEDLNMLYANGVTQAFVTVGSVGIPHLRLKLYEKLKEIGFEIPNIIDTTAIIDSSVKMGIGNFIGKGVIINTETIIGNNCIINTGSIIEHECIIENHTHIAPGVTLCGGVTIGESTHIGAGTTIIQARKIGSNSIIGSGSVVVKDIEGAVKAYGNPCKIVEDCI